MTSVLGLQDAPPASALPGDPLSFLEMLDGPVAWRVRGRDRTRTRLVTTLLHGNEPSGLVALHAWLASDPSPAVDVVCVLANVESARLHPAFTHRMVPGRRDLNRCFLGPFDDVEGRLARAVLDLVDEVAPEALVDLHNNTGRNPAYAVGAVASPEALGLCAIFGRHFVWSHITLGALLEAVPSCPAITVEVGKSGDEAANRVAFEGLLRFVSADRLFAQAGGLAPGVGAFAPEQVQVLRMPMRATLTPGCRLVMSTRPDAAADLTMPDDLDRHNFEVVDAGARVGWVRGDAMPLRLTDEAGRDRTGEYFAREGDQIVARIPFMPIMITVDAAVAAADCLFYLVHPVVLGHPVVDPVEPPRPEPAADASETSRAGE